jgi:hypothetical protein
LTVKVTLVPTAVVATITCVFGLVPWVPVKPEVALPQSVIAVARFSAAVEAVVLLKNVPECVLLLQVSLPSEPAAIPAHENPEPDSLVEI